MQIFKPTMGSITKGFTKTTNQLKDLMITNNQKVKDNNHSIAGLIKQQQNLEVSNSDLLAENIKAAKIINNIDNLLN